MRKNIFSRCSVVLLSFLALLVLIYGLIQYVFPLQAYEISNRWELWREGVTQVESAGLHGYLHDTCQHAPKNKACSCVVMIHGLADDAMTWKKILLWPENGWLEPVKLYAFDLPGSGLSPAPAEPSGYRVRLQAARLKDALAPLCPHWIVVGNSLGGWIATWLALDWNEGVNKLLLLDSAGLKNESHQQEETLAFFLNPTVERMKEFQSRAYFKGRTLSEPVWRAVAERMKVSNAREVIQAQTSEDYLDGRLTTLRRPTQLFWGEADRIEPLAVGQHFRSLIPGAIWNPVPQCGHLPQKECPVDVIKAIYNMVTFGGV